MAVESLVELQKPTGTPEDWLEWVLYRLQREPWALGGFVVIGVFVLGTLSLAIFALLYGCCCSRGEGKPNKKRQQKKSKDTVI